MSLDKKNVIPDELSFYEIMVKLKVWISYLLERWLPMLLIGIIAGVLGYFYASIKPKTYITKLSFVLEEGKTSGGLNSLAGQFGFDLGSNNSSLLSGDNMLMFLKSRSLVRETLLSAYDSSKGLSLADKYAEVYNFKKEWLKNKKIKNPVSFNVNEVKSFTRQQDSLLNTITSRIIKYELIIERPEKKATFITVQSSQRDEMLCKWFCERLVQNATDRYVQLKIKRQKANVERLQNRADSIASVLNNKTYSTALQQEKLLDINPGSRTVTVNSEISGRDKIMLATIYGEVVKNLEIAKFQLTQETPTIQVIDKPELPLTRVKKSKILFALIFTIVAGFILVFFYSLKFYLKKLKEERFVNK